MEDVFGVRQHIRRTDPAQVKLVLTIETKDDGKDGKTYGEWVILIGKEE